MVVAVLLCCGVRRCGCVTNWRRFICFTFSCCMYPFIQWPVASRGAVVKKIKLGRKYRVLVVQALRLQYRVVQQRYICIHARRYTCTPCIPYTYEHSCVTVLVCEASMRVYLATVDSNNNRTRVQVAVFKVFIMIIIYIFCTYVHIHMNACTLVLHNKHITLYTHITRCTCARGYTGTFK